MIDEAFLTTEEVLEYLQVTQRTVYRLIKAGRMKEALELYRWVQHEEDARATLVKSPEEIHGLLVPHRRPNEKCREWPISLCSAGAAVFKSGPMLLLDKVTRVHLIGICGTGMASLAAMFKEAGYTVSGSDEGIYPPMSEFLAEKGIPVFQGYSLANMRPEPDLVVIGNALSRGNPEIEYVLNFDVPYTSFPEALKEFFLRKKLPVVITGTHGKTTTTSLVATVRRDRIGPTSRDDRDRRRRNDHVRVARLRARLPAGATPDRGCHRPSQRR